MSHPLHKQATKSQYGYAVCRTANDHYALLMTHYAMLMTI
jgi:hypothetical protein